MMPRTHPHRFRLPDRAPFDPADEGCVVCEGPANGRLHCVDHEPVYYVNPSFDQQTEASR